MFFHGWRSCRRMRICGRYGGPRDLEVHAGYLPVQKPFAHLPLKSEYRPTDLAPVFVKNRDGDIVIKDMRWWFVPSSFSGPLKDWKATTFNARLDEVGQKPTFRKAWDLKRRVIVPASYYNEWTGPAGRKRCWEVGRADGLPIGMAGIWDYAQTAEGPLLSFAILTRTPGPVMQQLHPREPVVLDSAEWQSWLAGADALPLAAPWADNAFTVDAA